MKIEYKNPADLHVYENNARQHSDEQVAQISASIVEFGFNNPLLINSKNRVIAGHGRLLAALEIGLESVPCIALKGLTKKQERAYVIADNQIALNSEWDFSKLAIEVQELTDEGFDIELLALPEWNQIDSGKEIDLDKEGDTQILKIEIASENYGKIVEALRAINEDYETALIELLL